MATRKTLLALSPDARARLTEIVGTQENATLSDVASRAILAYTPPKGPCPPGVQSQIQSMREAKGMSLTVLSRASGVPYHTLRRMERRLVKTSPDSLAKIVKAIVLF